MSVTSTTAPSRPALNTWKTRKVIINDDGTGLVSIDSRSNTGETMSVAIIQVLAGAADKLIYKANGEIDQQQLGVTSAGIGAALLTALSSGSLAARFQAVDDLLQTRGVIPA